MCRRSTIGVLVMIIGCFAVVSAPQHYGWESVKRLPSLLFSSLVFTIWLEPFAVNGVRLMSSTASSPAGVRRDRQFLDFEPY